MADTASEILEKWREHIPPEVPKEDVEKVVEAYFPGLYQYPEGKGSHWLRVSDPVLKMLQEKGFDTGTLGGVLSFSHTKGRRVKQYLVKNLVDAITLKEEWNKLPEQQKGRQK